jgi:superfamily II helicase
MKKGYKFDDLSDKVCETKGCYRLLKRRRVEVHDDTICYRCSQKKLRSLGKRHRNLSKAYHRSVPVAA